MATRVPPLAELHGCDEAEALARVAAVAESLAHAPKPGDIAASLPRSLAGLGAELSLALANLALRLVRFDPPLPEGRDALAPAVAIAWLRVELAAGPSPARLAELDDLGLLRAIAEPLPLTPALLDRLAHADDPRLRELAIDRIGRAIAELATTPEHACVLLLELGSDAEPRLRRAAFEALDHAYLSELPERMLARRRELLDAALDQDELAPRCARLAAGWHERELLRASAFEHPSASRRSTALAELGPLAHDDDLEPALRVAAEDPLRFGASLRAFLLAAHRCGVFLRETHLPALLDAFDAHHGWTAVELVRVTHIVRRELVATLAQLPADDPRWLRRAAILAAAVDTDAHLVLADRLQSCTDARIAGALIDAAARSVAFDDELALLAWLDRLPEPVVLALRCKGGEQAAARLHELVADPRCPSSLRELALPSLWALVDDRPALLRELGSLLGPRAGGLLQTKHLSSRDPTAAMILRELDWDAELEPLEALRLLCEAGKRELLPDIVRLFRQIVSEYVGEALAGDFTIKRQRMPELEQLMYRYGRHLLADGRSVRRWHDDAPETGDDLLLGVVVEWLHEDPPPAIAVALLETLTRKQIRGAWLRQIEGLWRHREIEVQRAALEAIIAGQDDARGLELSIARLAAHDNERVARQAVLGIAALRARWAEPMVIAALERPQMLLKREAAGALARIGSSACVPVLVGWLARHDNAGFRADLLAALHEIAGTYTGAILIAAMRTSDDARARGLLRQAVNRRLNLGAAMTLASSEHPADRELIDAMLAGEVALVDANAEQLAASLHRAKLRALPEPKLDPTQRLRIEGFSPAAAMELLTSSEGKLVAGLTPLIRNELAAWLGWLQSSDASAQRNTAIEWLLEAALPRHVEHDDALLELAATPGLSAWIVFGFIERQATVARDPAWQARARALLRSLPGSPQVSGLRRYRLLATLAAARTREDLDRCLADCAIGPNLPGDSAQLLTDALALQAKRPDEPEALSQLREQIANYYRLPADEAARWLDAQLRERPLDLPALDDWARPSAPQAKPKSRAELDALLQLVNEDGPDRPARARAAERLLAWPEARDIDGCWARVLDRYLEDALDLSPASVARLAATLEQWPTPTTPRSLTLLGSLDPRQRRAFLPAWIRSWERGEPHAEELLRSVGETLIPIARARAEAGDYVLLRLLRPSQTPAMRELIAFVQARAPEEVAHLVPPEPVRAASSLADPLADPLADQARDELLELIADRRTEVGLAVRGIHRLAQLEHSADALARLSSDRRPRVRSAALRSLRKHGTREHYLETVVEVLQIETRKDVIASLLAAIAHAHYEPGLGQVVERLWSSDTKLVDAAEQALLAWGPAVRPSLIKLARKARPDRRERLDEIIAQRED